MALNSSFSTVRRSLLWGFTGGLGSSLGASAPLRTTALRRAQTAALLLRPSAPPLRTAARRPRLASSHTVAPCRKLSTGKPRRRRAVNEAVVSRPHPVALDVPTIAFIPCRHPGPKSGGTTSSRTTSIAEAEAAGEDALVEAPLTTSEKVSATFWIGALILGG